MEILNPPADQFPPRDQEAERFNGEVLVRLRIALGGALGLPVTRSETPPHPLLNLPLGAFFTITKGEELRGCLGRFSDGHTPLWLLIQEFSPRVLTEDPRFPPVKRDEAPWLEMEASILYDLQELKDPYDFEPGIHGLILKTSQGHTTLLPRVARDHHLDRSGFLKALAQKAGIAFEVCDLHKHLYFRYKVYSVSGPLLPS